MKDNILGNVVHFTYTKFHWCHGECETYASKEIQNKINNEYY